ncbi:MAG: hypothetical protein PVI86_07925 [Phycisphaerae bacterium]|jgi:hypothetical protein
MLENIRHELKTHAPFTAFGALTGIGIMGAIVYGEIPSSTSSALFWAFHPLHVLLSALVTTALYRLHGQRGLGGTILVGYLGSVGIATVSDSIIPYVSEALLELPNKGIHLGFIEKWWLVNPLALTGIVIACFYPRTKLPHAGHVLLSTWASLFHMMMAIGERVDTLTVGLLAVFLFLAVWVPCCTSDIVFPLLFSSGRAGLASRETAHSESARTQMS